VGTGKGVARLQVVTQIESIVVDRFDIRCSKPGTTTLKLRYKRSWEERYSWESRLEVSTFFAFLMTQP